MKHPLQMAQISYNICFHQTRVHSEVLHLSLGKKCRLREFLQSDLIMNKRTDNVPTLKYIFTCI